MIIIIIIIIKRAVEKYPYNIILKKQDKVKTKHSLTGIYKFESPTI